MSTSTALLRHKPLRPPSDLATPPRATRARTRLLAGVALALLVSACGQRVPEFSPPPTPPAVAEFPVRAPSADPSVPPADSVALPAGATAGPDARAGRTNAAMTRGEESAAMPMPGQNNDHSAPLAPAKRASSPK